MQVKELKQEGLSHELEVTLKADDIDARVDARLKEVSQTVNLPGFRKGKVPMTLMKQRYGKAVLGEVLEAAVNDSSAQAMKDKDITPAMQPKIEIKEFDEGKDLIYTMEIEVLPKVEIQDYKGIKVTKLVAKATDADIDEALERIASMRETTKPIETKRASKDGDIVKIDFDGRTADDNVKQPGMAAEGHNLKLGSGQFIPGFEEQLVGKKAGEEVEVKVSFPENYGAAELAGREAIFDVKIHDILEAVPAEINDDFAKSLGMEDAAALRKAVEDQTNQEFANHSRLKLKKELLDQLDEAYSFDIPKGMQEAELENIKHQVKVENQQQGIDAEPTEDELKELEAISERRVRLGLVLSEIGKEAKITVADNELQGAVIREAQKYPGQEKEVFDYFSKNRQALESLRAPLYEDKVVDYILELVTVEEKEVSKEELTAEEEEAAAPKKAAAKKKAPAKKKTAAKSEEKADEKPAEKKKAAPKKAAAKKKAS